MASSSPAMKFSLLLLFTLLSYPQAQARDSQLFNKVSPSFGGASAAATTAVPNQDPPLNNNQQKQEQEQEQEPEPSFFPQEKGNGYGLYGRESRQLPRPTTGAAAESEDHPNRHLPRNYNTVEYLTEPEEDTEDNDDNEDDSEPEVSYTTTLQNYYNDARKSKQNQQEDEERREPEQYRSSYNNYQYSGGSSFNSEPQGDARGSYLYNGGEESGFRPQGMSDTRSLENGKYFYDIKTEKYSRNHPYAVLNNNYNDQRNYENNENSMSESYQNQYEFQNEGNMP